MIDFCRSCKNFSFTLDENRICRVCLRLTEMRRAVSHPHTHDDSHDLKYGETSVLSEQSNDSKEVFFEGGSSGGGGASGDFSLDDSIKDSLSCDESHNDSGSDDSGSDDSGSDSSSDND